jgi:hypothetical protein
MNKSDGIESRAFRCKKATVHFIFSFMADIGDERESIATLFREQSTKDCLRKLAVENGVDAGLPENRLGVTPHLRLRPDCGWLVCPPRRVWLLDQELLVSTQIRHFSAGATCTYKVELQGAPAGGFNSSHILQTLKVTRQTPKHQAPELRDTNDGPVAGTLHQRFSILVREYCKALRFAWLDEDEAKAGTQGVLDEGKDQQNPWAVTVAEVEGEIADAFCHSGGDGLDPAEAKMLRIRRYEPEIADVVFLSVADHLVLEPAYVQPPNFRSLPGIYSVNVDARLFVCMSRRSILCICRDAGQDPALYFIPGLLDICESIRARWHALVAINRIMDRAMRDFSQLKKDAVKNRETLKSLRVKLVNALEDPTMYIVAGDALSKIMQDLITMFRLEDLRTALIRKMDLLEKIYLDARQLKWLTDASDDVDASNEEKVP